jgi:cellulose synthase/poly-beta-1,6-N-acetylglucosamine synthase-like glycosyltransferase
MTEVDVGAGLPVTVLVLCYNHERFVENCLESIRAQTFQDFQLIVCDDASKDHSASIAETWLARHRADALFIRNRTNQGVCRTLNNALTMSRGRFISMIAADDMWEPGKIERQLTCLESEGDEVAMVYSDASLMNLDGRPLPGKFIAKYRPDFDPPSGDIFNVLAAGNFIPAMSTMIRTQALHAVGGYDEELAYEDYDMWLRLAARYDIMFVEGLLARYRIVAGSLGDQLFTTHSTAAIAADCRIALKLLEVPRLTPLQRARWLGVLEGGSYHLFCTGDARAARYLRAASIRTRNPRWMLLALAASVGLSRPRLRRILSFASVRSRQ